MCGIAGAIALRDIPPDERTVERMLSVLRHRGPDSFVVRTLGRACFGHARLAIVDLTEGANQPMAYLDGRYWITYNGEVFNFIELRAELEAKGCRFRTKSDAEVILAAYHCWGAECLERFNGMWALAILDAADGSCFLARDRFGVKPLYYAEHGGALLFASEMKALAVAGVDTAPNPEALRSYFAQTAVDRGAETAFRHISALAPGHCLTVRDGRLTVRQWWRTRDRLIDVPRSWPERVEAFRALLTDAVRLRLRNDVPTALTLSGGMDSSSVHVLTRELQERHEVVSASDREPKEVALFSVTQPGDRTDESGFVRACVEPRGEQVHWINPRPEAFPAMLEDIVWKQDALTWGVAVFALHITYREIARAGIRVVLEGHGSDEMLGGYDCFLGSALSSYAAQGRWWQAWRAARGLHRAANPNLDVRKPRALGLLLGQMRLGRALLGARDRLLRRRRGPAEGDAAAKPYLVPELRPAGPVAPLIADDLRGLPRLKRDLYFAFHEWILPMVLRTFDRATMAASVESRMPFMDWRLVQFVFSLPEADLVGDGETKHILRAAMRGRLPAAVLDRREKMGFSVAAPAWLSSPEARAVLTDMIHSADFRSQGWVLGREFADYYDRCLARGMTWQDGSRIWEVVNLYVWHRLFVERRFPAGCSEAAGAQDGGRVRCS